MKKTLLYIGLFFVLFFIGFFIAQYINNGEKSFKRVQIHLGTVVEIQVRNADEKKAEDAITKAFSEVKRIDDYFSTFNKNGPVWMINNSSDSVLSTNEEIYKLMVLSDSLWKISSGKFDAAIESLVNVWGFNGDSPAIPSEAEIKSSLKESGWNKIKLLNENRFIRKGNVKINFNAIAKGYAVDCAVQVLRKEGISEALVNAGGEIKSLGEDWIVGIQHPKEKGALIARIKLDKLSAATSGNYENYFEENGIRYHHILDPHTGYPAGGLKSVTVINKSNAFADGLATAFFVMGKNKSMQLIEKLTDTEAMIIDDEDNIIYSSGFKKFLLEMNRK